MRVWIIVKVSFAQLGIDRDAEVLEIWAGIAHSRTSSRKRYCMLGSSGTYGMQRHPWLRLWSQVDDNTSERIDQHNDVAYGA